MKKVSSYAVLNMSQKYSYSSGTVFFYQTDYYCNITAYIKNLPSELADAKKYVIYMHIKDICEEKCNMPIIYFDNGKGKMSLSTKEYKATDYVGKNVTILLENLINGETEIMATGTIIEDKRKYDYHFNKIW